MNSDNVGLPDKISLIDHIDYIEIVRRWLSWHVVLLGVFALLWDAFLLSWYSIAFSHPNPLTAMLYIPILHLIVGGSVTYAALAGWLNRTRILVSRDDLAIRHAPLPWWGGVEMKSADVQQLYTKEVVSYTRNGRIVRYQLRVITRDRRDLKLLSGLENSEQAVYIEQAIEKYLHIIDVPVAGELAGRERNTPPSAF